MICFRGDSTYTPNNHHIPETRPVPHYSESAPRAKSDQPSASAATDSSSRIQQQRRAESTNKPARTVSTPLKISSDKPANGQQHATPQLDDSTRLASAIPAKKGRATPERNQTKSKSKSASVASHRRPLSHSLEVENLPDSKTPTAVDVTGRVSTAGLTSTPSGELAMASQLTMQPLHHYNAGLSDFFLAGLGGGERDDNMMRDEGGSHGATMPVSKLPDCSYKGILVN